MTQNEEFMMALEDFKLICEYEKQATDCGKKSQEILKQAINLEAEICNKEKQLEFLYSYLDQIELTQRLAKKNVDVLRMKQEK